MELPPAEPVGAVHNPVAVAAEPMYVVAVDTAAAVDIAVVADIAVEPTDVVAHIEVAVGAAPAVEDTLAALAGHIRAVEDIQDAPSGSAVPVRQLVSDLPGLLHRVGPGPLILHHPVSCNIACKWTT